MAGLGKPISLVDLRLRSNKARGPLARKPYGRQVFWPQPLLARHSKPALGMLVPRRLGCGQNPLPQNPSYFQNTLLGLEEVRIAPRSPWQSPYIERLIGSVRREYLDHVIVFNQDHLHRLLESYFSYYDRSRTHLALDKDAPEPRPVRGPEEGKIVSIDEVGGLHHRYERLAA